MSDEEAAKQAADRVWGDYEFMEIYPSLEDAEAGTNKKPPTKEKSSG
jgi:hypothetical protein